MVVTLLPWLVETFIDASILKKHTGLSCRIFLLEVLWCDCPIGHNNGCAVGLYQLRDGTGMAALRSEHGGLGRLGRSVDFPFRTDAAHGEAVMKKVRNVIKKEQVMIYLLVFIFIVVVLILLLVLNSLYKRTNAYKNQFVDLGKFGNAANLKDGSRLTW